MTPARPATPLDEKALDAASTAYSHQLGDAPEFRGKYREFLRPIISAYLAALPPQDAGRRGEVEAAKRFGGMWNNWIAPFHRCASCGDSLNWQQSVDVFDRPLISASCACGVMCSARLSEEGLEQGRAVDAGNKLAAEISDALTRTTEVNAAIDEFHDAVIDACEYSRPIDINARQAAKNAARTALLALLGPAGVPTKEPAHETSENIALNYVPAVVGSFTFRDRVALVEAGRAMRDDFDTDVLRALCGEAAQCTAGVDNDAARELTARLNQAWHGEDPVAVPAHGAGETITISRADYEALLDRADPVRLVERMLDSGDGDSQNTPPREDR